MDQNYKPKILVVDDESTHQLAILDAIEAYEKDYELLSAFNGKEAFEIALKEKPQLIITDWEMPEMDGLAFIQELKKDRRLSDIPVIMCTGIMTSSENLQHALEAGANDYIRKPIDEIELLARINAKLHLAEKFAQIKQLNATKDQIFSVISHDLRGPVGTFKGLVELMLANIHKYPLDKLEEIAYLLNKQCSSVYTVLENLLSWARSQQDKTKYSPAKYNLADVVAEELSIYEVLAQQKGLVLEHHIPKTMTATFDRDLIASVFKNLLNNAIKFSYEGGVITVDVNEGDQFHTIKVSDQGLGIKPEVLAKLFDKTTFVTTFGTKNEKGSGLGLKLCREFVEMHNGKIWVESEVGKGSQFYFTLPC